jgi:hypothetical protein
VNSSNVYSFKVDRDKLERAKSFFTRQGVPLQNSLRDLIDVAADCEECLQLHEAQAPIGELQSAFTSLLADSKNTWHMNGIFREAVLKIAGITEMPTEVIDNVIGEAQRNKPDTPQVITSTHRQSANTSKE